LRKIYYQNKLIGIVIRGSYPKGSVPQTNAEIHEEALGLLTFNHLKGTTLKRHRHQPTKRITHTLQECFVVLSGKIKIKIYSEDEKYVTSIILKSSEAFLAINCGHEFKILENATMLELKNGPFKNDKLFF